MKNKINYIIRSLAIVAALSASLLLTNCGHPAKGNANHETEASDTLHLSAEKMACPMHPEVTGKSGDTCPKCGMNLTEVSEEQVNNTNVYFMKYNSISELRSAEASTLSFKPLIKGKESEPVDLEIQQDKKIHLIIVSKDLSYFDHVHPELQGNGSYDVKVLANGTDYSKGKFQNETKFSNGGEFVLFADYMPSGATHQVERIELKVGGKQLPAHRCYSVASLVSVVDGYEVSLVTEGGRFFNEGTSHIAAIIKKDGLQIDPATFEDFLAAKAHVVMISEDTKNYLHVHPKVKNGRLALHTTFEVTGIFRGWLQFKTNGMVHTADFVVKVEEGQAPQHGEVKDDHH